METTTCLREQDIWCVLTNEDEIEESVRAHYRSCPVCQKQAAEMRGYFQKMQADVAALQGPWQPQPLRERFEFLRRLGRGGFGEVWLARDLKLGRQVAIKTLRQDRMRPDSLAALQAEAKQVAELTQKRRARRHLVEVYEFTVAGGECFLVMEYVEGGSLAERLRQFGPLHWPVATRYIADVAEALAELHSRGLVHRDIKPANILWDSATDEALLADFGLAAAVAAVNEVCGTPGYMAPEQWDGRPIPASDVFALAATLFTFVTGEPPFVNEPPAEARDACRHGLPLVDRRLQCVPSAIETSLRRALSARTGDRPSLTEWTALLRGGAVSAFADAISRISSAKSAGAGEPQLTVDVWIARPDQPFQRAVLPTTTIYRDMSLVDPETPPLSVPTGSKVRMCFATPTGGYFTLLNHGSSGAVSVLVPTDAMPSVFLPPGWTKEFIVELSPPAGIDEAVAILSREPAPLLPQEWMERLRQGQKALDAYEAYREMKLLTDELGQLSAHTLAAVTVRLKHA